MLSLRSSTLSVSLLDPRTGTERIGPRYCAGGQVLQVTDTSRSPAEAPGAGTLDGAWPTPSPDDLLSSLDLAGFLELNGGQGLPDSFTHRPLDSPDGARTALAIGVGLQSTPGPAGAPGARSVLELCDWTVEATPAPGWRFATAQTLGGWGLELERTVSLLGERTVRVETALRNTGELRIPLVWHPHPFYPWPTGKALMKTNLELSLQEGDGYSIDSAGYLCRETEDPQMGFLHHEARSDAPLMLVQPHPVVGMVAARCSYTPTFFPVWGNENTFSWEPYFERTVQMGQEERWHIDYEFGERPAEPS